MKKILSLIFLLFVSHQLFAQTGYNYYKYSVGEGINFSYVRASTSISTQSNHFAAGLTLNYNLSPFFLIVGEFQRGVLSGGGLTPIQDSLGRKYVNNYKSYLIYADLQLGQIINYRDNALLNILKNFYLGTGCGIIHNNVDNQRYNLFTTGYPAGTYRFPGVDISNDLLVPIKLGYEFKIYDKYYEPTCAINIEYVKNYAFGESIDGYDQSSVDNYTKPTSYKQFVIGFKYYIGELHSYRKPIIKMIDN